MEKKAITTKVMLGGVNEMGFAARVEDLVKAGTREQVAEHHAAQTMLDEVHLMLRFLVQRTLRR
jgi:hypothetical protein